MSDKTFRRSVLKRSPIDREMRVREFYFTVPLPVGGERCLIVPMFSLAKGMPCAESMLDEENVSRSLLMSIDGIRS